VSGSIESSDWDGVLSDFLPLQPFAIFCGAGISRLSGLPVVAEIVPAILHRLGADAATIATVSSLPFEAIIDVLAQHASIDDLLAIYKAGMPNVNHTFIANLVALGAVTDICTTNFDSLIEDACDAAGLRHGAEYTLLKDVPNLEKADWSPGAARVVKIHGCVSDTAGMAITIRQITTGILSAPKRAAIKHIFANGPHRSVLVLGYSCSDVFDLSPLIMSVASEGKPVFLVEHAPQPNGGLKVEPIQQREEKNPFREFRVGYRIFVDTNLFVQFLWNRLHVAAAYQAPEATSTDWVSVLDRWDEAIPSSEAPQIRAHLNYLAGMHMEGISEYGRVAETDGDVRHVAIALSNQVPMLLAAQQPDRAYEVCQRAISQFRRMPEMLPSLGNTLGWLGNCLLDLGRPVDALRPYEEAMTIMRLLGNRRGMGNQYGNIANAMYLLGRYAEALENHRIALDIAAEVGNIKGVINQYAGLSHVFLGMQQFAEAVRWAEKGAVTASNFGDARLESYLRSLADEARRSLGNGSAG
jgi:tetratricopeptide (TPR) repeat protein